MRRSLNLDNHKAMTPTEERTMDGERETLGQKHEVGPQSTYEIFLDATFHRRHCEDWKGKLSRCWKLVDTGKPREMMANALRGLADEVEAGEHDA